jgi:hypothetical protein
MVIHIVIWAITFNVMISKEAALALIQAVVNRLMLF